MQQPFTINNRFSVEPSLNLVRDLEQHTDIQLEPRLMEVLCTLAQHAGLLVSRAEFASQVWKDYGGAGDGLTQAISFLRKALDDRSKQLIKTVSGKGYVLNAAITRGGEPGPAVPINKKRRLLRIAGWAATAIFFVLMYAIFGLDLTNNEDRIKEMKRGTGNAEQKQDAVKPTGYAESNSPKNKIADGEGMEDVSNSPKNKMAESMKDESNSPKKD